MGGSWGILSVVWGQGGRLKQTTTGTIQDLSYIYDAAGNILKITDAKASETLHYGYDALNRLTGVSGSVSETYTYDTQGRLANKTGMGSYTYQDANNIHAVTHLGGVLKYSYDANGNMRTRVVGWITYSLVYDAENRLESMTGTSLNANFVYNGDGERVKGTVNGVTTTYIGNYYEMTGTANTKYYYAAGVRTAEKRTGYADQNGVYWLLSDHLGSTTITAYTAGGKKAELRYAPWGWTRYSSGNTLTSQRYTGQREEDALDLYYYNSRWYDSQLGRFTSPDSIVPDESIPLSNDRYAYTFNNPINYSDPSGHCPWCVVIGAFIGAAVSYGTQVYNNYQNGVTGADAWTTNISGEKILGGAVVGGTIGLGVGVVTVAVGGGVTAAAGTGAASAATTTVLQATGGDPSDEIRATSQAYGNLSSAVNYGIQRGNQLSRTLSNTGLEAHHIVEQRFAPALGQTASQAKQWLSAAVTPQEHQVFTNNWRNAIGYINSNNPLNNANATANDLWTAAQRIYADYPALLDAARKTIFSE